MKIKYFIIILFLLTINIFCEHLNDYIFEVVNNIPSGKNEGMIGWKALPGGFTGPSTFFVADNKIFVPDRMNYRLNIYDRSLNFLETFFEKEDKKVHFTSTLKMDKNGNIIYISTSSGLKKVNKEGHLLFTIPNKILSKNVKNHRNYFPILDKIFIYNDKNEIECITNERKFIKGDKIRSEINNIENQWSNISEIKNMELPPDKMEIIEDLQQKNSYLIINDNLYYI